MDSGTIIRLNRFHELNVSNLLLGFDVVLTFSSQFVLFFGTSLFYPCLFLVSTAYALINTSTTTCELQMLLRQKHPNSECRPVSGLRSLLSLRASAW